MTPDYDDVQAIERIIQDRCILPLQKLLEQLHTAAGDFGHAYIFGKALAGIELAQAANTRTRIWQASAGKAPGANRCTNQSSYTRRTWKPVSEQRHVQPLDAKPFGPTCSARQNPDILRPQTIFADVCDRALARPKVESRGLDMNGCHVDLHRPGQGL